MAFVAEDGSGRSNATSLCEVTVADSFWADRDPTALWATGATATDKSAALIRASDYLRNQARYRWVGAKKTYAQTMPWPRIGAVERDGGAVPDTIVPWQVVEAACFLANTALTTDLQPSLEHGGKVQSESLTGVVSLTYQKDARADTAIQFVDGLLAPLLRRTGLDPMLPDFTSPDIPDGYADDQFTDVGEN